MTCPNCGGMANLVSGTFSEHGNGLEIVSAPVLTHLILNRLKDVAERAKAGTISPQEALEEARAISPRLANVMSLFIAAGLPILAVFISLIALYLQYQDSISSDEFEAAALKLLQEQASISQSVLHETQANHHKSIDNKSAGPAKPKPAKETSPGKSKSDRRKQVQKLRKKDLLNHRKAFNPKPMK